jgi:signal transduction histidine kinase
MQGVRDGRLDVRILAMGGDELGVIADSFNEMVAAMQKAAEESAQLHVQLDRFNQELQQRVEQASAELQQRYKELQQANEELLSVQMRLSRAERLAVAGQVAATFAHEIGSPLSAISTHLQLLLEDKNLATEVRERVAVVYEQIERIVGIVQQLLATSRPLDMRFEAVDVVECLSQVLGLSRQNLAARRIEVQERIPAGLPKVRGHAQQLQQVFLNLINNAADAMDNGGKLEIEVNVLEGSRPPSLELRFADTGPGIPSSQLTRIFQPFFTTKGTGKGSGLGLAISTEIVRGHGGKLEVSSMEGQGATFLVKLPCLIDEQLN